MFTLASPPIFHRLGSVGSETTERREEGFHPPSKNKASTWSLPPSYRAILGKISAGTLSRQLTMNAQKCSQVTIL